MSDLIDLLETVYFQTGLRIGLVALAIGLVLSLATKRDGRPLPIGGLLLTGAMFFAFWRLEVDVPTEGLAVVAILVGTSMARLLKTPDIVTAVASVPGAAWLGLSTEVTDITWVRVLFIVLIPVGGYLIADFETRHAGMGLGVIFYSLAVIGVFLAVPDTEWALTLLAVTVPITFLAWPRVRVSLGAEGGFLAVALFILVTAQGGGPRPASIIGGVACLGILLIEPILMRTTPGIVRLTAWPSRDWKGQIVASLPQLVVVALCSRIAARFTDDLPALIVVLLVYAGTIAIAISLAGEEAGSGVG